MTAPAGREYAGFVSRAAAFVVDVVLVTFLAAGALVGAQLLGNVFGTQAREFAHSLVRIFVIAMPALLALYNAAFWGLAGRTPGMALLGVRVVTTGGWDVSWLSSLIRAVVLAYFPIGALWSLIDRRHQAVHDKLARTTVVRVAPASVHTTALRGGPAGMQPSSSEPF